ncbi:MAG: bifunctional sulfate adenylyltransferase/adenylylsulfate kinase [Gammaproteobacteria bacterium]|nr:bifunctional sulfate adenylyltransferase/adenylylsulfate kinase [Gammaproteobacteria bacterium]NNJ85133.1 bifunctional sulfate adenylyltransferase/adenylylsulfate kinase [Gammaproteobacteria bacterium]
MQTANEPRDSLPRELIVDESRAAALKTESVEYASHTLSMRQTCDLELLLNGGFFPLSGFMDRQTYESVLSDLRLGDGSVWPMPIVLDVNAAFAETLEPGGKLALRDDEGFMLAVLDIEDIWQPDKKQEAQAVYGTLSREHPGVRALFDDVGDYYVGGRLTGIQLPMHSDYEELRHTPAELRRSFAKLGWRRIVGFHTSQPMHRLQWEVTMHAAKTAQAHLLLHPVVGISRPGDLVYHARAKCYQAILQYYPHGLGMLSLLPLAMRMAGPREALWHALIRKNYGCTHFIVGNDHGGPWQTAEAMPAFYPRYAAQELVAEYQQEIGIEAVPLKRLCYAPKQNRFIEREETDGTDEPCIRLSAREVAEHLSRGEELPDWFTWPQVLDALRAAHLPRSRQGITLFFTGLSGSGKSTLARIMYGKFIEQGDRPVTLLDGDIVRQNLSSELGFSKAHRDINIRRIGFVAAEITKNRGVAICAPIAPYAETRAAVRSLIEEHGAFVEIHVSTPLEICEARDRKGLYVKARKGIIPEFTGISDPYDIPENPELRIDTADLSPMQAAQEIFLYLLREGYLG